MHSHYTCTPARLYMRFHVDQPIPTGRARQTTPCRAQGAVPILPNCRRRRPYPPQWPGAPSLSMQCRVRLRLFKAAAPIHAAVCTSPPLPLQPLFLAGRTGPASVSVSRRARVRVCIAPGSARRSRHYSGRRTRGHGLYQGDADCMGPRRHPVHAPRTRTPYTHPAARALNLNAAQPTRAFIPRRARFRPAIRRPRHVCVTA
jgi:hypothetical protein